MMESAEAMEHPTRKCMLYADTTLKGLSSEATTRSLQLKREASGSETVKVGKKRKGPEKPVANGEEKPVANGAEPMTTDKPLATWQKQKMAKMKTQMSEEVTQLLGPLLGVRIAATRILAAGA